MNITVGSNITLHQSSWHPSVASPCLFAFPLLHVSLYQEDQTIRHFPVSPKLVWDVIKRCEHNIFTL